MANAAANAQSAIRLPTTTNGHQPRELSAAEFAKREHDATRSNPQAPIPRLKRAATALHQANERLAPRCGTKLCQPQHKLQHIQGNSHRSVARAYVAQCTRMHRPNAALYQPMCARNASSAGRAAEKRGADARNDTAGAKNSQSHGFAGVQHFATIADDAIVAFQLQLAVVRGDGCNASANLEVLVWLQIAPAIRRFALATPMALVNVSTLVSLGIAADTEHNRAAKPGLRARSAAHNWLSRRHLLVAAKAQPTRHGGSASFHGKQRPRRVPTLRHPT